jgi:hypothetical protein
VCTETGENRPFCRRSAAGREFLAISPEIGLKMTPKISKQRFTRQRVKYPG